MISQRGRGARATATLLLAAVALVGLAAAETAAKPKNAAPSSRAAATTRRVTPKGWFAVPKAQHPPLPKEVTRAFVIPIHDSPINNNTYAAMRRKVAQCRAKGAQLIIFDMNTKGGENVAMEKIVELIFEELESIRTVAYVNKQAFSAGAIISVACNEIAVARRSVIGTSMTILSSPTGIVEIPDMVRKKFESGSRGVARTFIENDENRQVLFQGMITLSWEIWLIRNRDTGESRIVRVRDWRHRVAKAPPSTQPGAAAIKPPADTPWHWVETIVGPDELVTLTDIEAIELGFVENRFSTMKDLKRHYNVTVGPTFLGDTASEKFVRLLTAQGLTMLLMMGMIFFAYIEMNTPGFGVAGGIAVACLAVLVGSRFLVGQANAIEIAVMVIGLVLLVLEIFVTPGFGLLGVTGILLVIGALLAMVVPNAPDKFPLPETELDWSVFSSGVFALGVGLLAALVASAIAAKYLPKTSLANELILLPAEAATDAPVADGSPMKHIKVGDIGTVEAVCRPVGKVRFDEELFDAASEGGIIQAGKKVRVLRRDGNRLIVEEA